MFWVGLLALVFVLRCHFTEQNIKQLVPTTAVGIISPDKVVVNGDLLSGELQEKKQTINFTYRLKNQAEQRYWLDLNGLVEVKGSIQKVIPIFGPRNIGEFNYKKYLSHKNIFYSVQLTRMTTRIHQPITIFEKINVLRLHLLNHFKKLPKWLRIHAQSLIVGYTGHSDKEFLTILSTLGVIHLFSLSGLHVLILLTLLRKLTSLFKIPLEYVNYAMLMLLPCYGMLVGSKSGIWRAIILAMVVIVTQKLSFNLSRLDLYSLTMLICTLIYPFAIIEMGGQLSFLLSFAILYLYEQSNFILTIFKMNLISLPIICFYTYQFNWLTLFANMFFIPFFSFFILPITLISSLTVEWKFWKIVNYSFVQIYGILESITQNSKFVLITGRFTSLAVIWLIIVALFYVEKKGFRSKYLLMYSLSFLLCFLINKVPLFGSVSLIDVGQGDSILITTPIFRETFLIDVGGKITFPVESWAKRTSSNQVDTSTIPMLKSQGIAKIDKVFLTHKDVDHVGNLETLLSKFLVKEVDFGSGLENNSRIKLIIKKHPEIKFKNLHQGDVLKTKNIKWQILWPQKSSPGENGDSLTILAQIKNKIWLFTGDLDQKGEHEILKSFHFKIDYLKVGHHGSRTSTSQELLQVLHPQRAFISAGVENRYGHPNKETLERLSRAGVEYFNTADYGMISWYYYFFNNRERTTTFLKGDLVENNRIKK